MGNILYAQPSDEQRQSPAIQKRGDARSPYRRDLARLIHSTGFRRLQGKTQLFPSDENDFYRNRLTHSLEVAQIASGIALDLNEKHKGNFLRDSPIDVDLVTFAALAHDLGHPPFGHRGERILDRLMIKNGGFEGNAQTLRILARLEKKTTATFPNASEPDPVGARKDNRTGLNLTYRTLASVLKYDKQIPRARTLKSWKRPSKGYYETEAELVREIQHAVAPGFRKRKNDQFRTVECQIMDLADDIAYSTYDLEDAFKAEFMTPALMASVENRFKERIAAFINDKMKEEYGQDVATRQPITVSEIDQIIQTTFQELFSPSPDLQRLLKKPRKNDVAALYASAAEVNAASAALVENGYFRLDFTSRLVHALMSGVILVPNPKFPQLSKVQLNLKTFKIVETLKRFVFESLISSPRLNIAEYRGKEIVSTIFNILSSDEGSQLLPNDWRQIYNAQEDRAWRMRSVCDFIACMTDRYCLEFYSRLMGIDAPSMHKPY